MRADRLIALLLTLQIHGSLPARVLAEQLGVSKRTIFRDVEALSLAGIPVYALRGSEGGIALDENYRFSPGSLSSAELEALLVAGGSGPLRDLGLEDASGSVMLKLMAALPEMQRGEARRIRQRVYIDPEGWFDEDEPLPCLPALQQAVWEDRVVRITYQHGDGSLAERVLEACSLVAKAGAWYLLGCQPGRPPGGELRTYRVSRIQAVEITAECFRRAPDFDLAEYWQAHSRAFVGAIKQDRDPFEVTVRVRLRSLWLLVKGLSGRYERVDGAEESSAEDASEAWITLRITFSHPYPAQMRILSLGSEVEALEPESFRAALREELERAARIYG